ncbi:hypothetical protein M0R04_11270 [Candidatus Dojkabacteria bacterium]|jgi:hypothetical protein|nr:hypothetical protein [Candidatus Dojkabacteria bacterium]
MVNWVDLGTAILIPIGRSLSGWFQNCYLDDGKVQDFEWRLLASTILSVGVPSVALYFSFNAAGIDLSALGAACGGLLVDMVLRAIKAKKKA